MLVRTFFPVFTIPSVELEPARGFPGLTTRLSYGRSGQRQTIAFCLITGKEVTEIPECWLSCLSIQQTAATISNHVQSKHFKDALDALGYAPNLSLCFEPLSHHSLQDRSTIRRVDHGTEIVEIVRAPRRRVSFKAYNAPYWFGG